MTTRQLLPGYCIDTSALIDLKPYPPDIFTTLWQNLVDLVRTGSLVAPLEVFLEIVSGKDELSKWAKQHKDMFKDLDSDQIQQVRSILVRFPKLVDESKTTPDADPFVVALAVVTGLTVVTSEKSSVGGRPKIPDVCSHYSVRCIPLFEMFREQRWSF